MINNELELIQKYNELESVISKLAKKFPSSFDVLRHLTDEQLSLFIAGRTLAFGRDWEASIANGEYHIKNRERAIRLFGSKQDDLLGAV